MRSIFVILIGKVYHSILVFNKSSCRPSGSFLKTFLLCKFCNETVLWICHTCNKIKEFNHFNYFFTTLIPRRLDLLSEDSNPFEMIINR